jgi:ABC-type thiamin/hydroxymethylpyrimidine transport system permease subunit
MSDLITTSQDAYRNVCIDAFVATQSFVTSLAERSREDRGQTAAEYMGVLLLVSTIIAAIFVSKPGEAIAGKIGEMITKIVSPG